MHCIKRLATVMLLACALRLPAAIASETLIIHVYLHDELASVTEEALYYDYLKHWEDEMHAFTSQSIEVIYHRDIPGITDIEYAARNNASSTLQAFHNAMAELRFQHYPKAINKSILVTQNGYELLDNGKTVEGLAQFEGISAIASRSSFANLGHEIGHMLGATHEHAETVRTPLLVKCETYVYPERAWDRSNCYRYSDDNRQNIVAHLRNHQP
ncbi:hypothetical protein [Pseudomonas sp. CC120222-01a]|uniref:hypothetical protein n=1 Tax=Pseudomonas sp. CC120222-01a TaxID=1378075 RepID=UPI000D8EEE8E|nr:hypothetical protein [Pseudomonas sp. CC120222-01a]PVZ38771.1 hypothetical protein N430_04186 [Pseudomonas sp. CC120222-01a]